MHGVCADVLEGCGGKPGGAPRTTAAAEARRAAGGAAGADQRGPGHAESRAQPAGGGALGRPGTGPGTGSARHRGSGRGTRGRRVRRPRRDRTGRHTAVRLPHGGRHRGADLRDRPLSGGPRHPRRADPEPAFAAAREDLRASGLVRLPAQPPADEQLPRRPDPGPRPGLRQPVPDRETKWCGVRRGGRVGAVHAGRGRRRGHRQRAPVRGVPAARALAARERRDRPQPDVRYRPRRFPGTDRRAGPGDLGFGTRGGRHAHGEHEVAQCGDRRRCGRGGTPRSGAAHAGKPDGAGVRRGGPGHQRRRRP